MGTNAAVHIANYYLITYELIFIKNLINNNELITLEKYRHTIRYLDDILSIDNTAFHSLLYNSTSVPTTGLYPPDLTIQLIDNKIPIHYMDIEIHLSNTLNTLTKKPFFYTAIHDKYNEPKYAHIPNIRYPHIISLISTSIGHNIISSQGYRFLRINTLRNNFIRDMTNLISTLIRKGYNINTLLQVTHKFIKRASKRNTLYHVNYLTTYKTIEKRFKHKPRPQ